MFDLRLRKAAAPAVVLIISNESLVVRSARIEIFSAERFTVLAVFLRDEWLREAKYLAIELFLHFRPAPLDSIFRSLIRR